MLKEDILEYLKTEEKENFIKDKEDLKEPLKKFYYHCKWWSCRSRPGYKSVLDYAVDIKSAEKIEHICPFCDTKRTLIID